MVEKDKISREWVEVAEEGSGGRVVLRSVSAPIPPSRGGRRRLVLESGGASHARAAGASDRVEEKGAGRWSLDGDHLQLALEGWEGDFDVEEVSDDRLVLRRR